jgi:drug/metabolite transporter (DMT)-like permease
VERVEILLAIAAAAAYGVSDFGGGALTRRANALVVFLLSQLVSSALLVVVVGLWADAASWPGIGWGAAAGLAGAAGTSLLYQGLAIGRMSVVAPITAVVGAALPVLFGLATGERPGAAALIGIVIGLSAVVVITRTPEPAAARIGANRTDSSTSSTVRPADPRAKQAVICAFGAGIGFGLFFVLLARAPLGSGLWPLLGMRAAAVVALGVLVTVRRLPVGIPERMGLGLVGLGIVNTLADLLYLLATRHGLLSLVAVITSMYPAVTVALAALVLRERITGRQLVGLAFAAASVALIALA